jgi:hypothetical protein
VKNAKIGGIQSAFGDPAGWARGAGRSGRAPSWPRQRPACAIDGPPRGGVSDYRAGATELGSAGAGSSYDVKARVLAARCLYELGDRQMSRRLLEQLRDESRSPNSDVLRCEIGDLYAQTHIGTGEERGAWRCLTSCSNRRRGLAWRSAGRTSCARVQSYSMRQGLLRRRELVSVLPCSAPARETILTDGPKPASSFGTGISVGIHARAKHSLHPCRSADDTGRGILAPHYSGADPRAFELSRMTNPSAIGG